MDLHRHNGSISHGYFIIKDTKKRLQIDKHCDARDESNQLQSQKHKRQYQAHYQPKGEIKQKKMMKKC